MTSAEGLVATVGREAELGAVARRLVEAQGGVGSVLLVAGEAGIGKSRILAEAGRRARARGMAVLSGRAVPGGGPFRPVAEALLSLATPATAEHPRLAPYRPVLGRLLPGWPATAAPDSALVDPVVLLGEAVRELLDVGGGERGLLVTLDDLHWADQDTLALLDYLVGRVAGTRVLVIGTARDDEHAPPGLAQLHRHPAVGVAPLHRLAPPEIAALARDRAGPLSDAAVDLVVRTSDGLPLLVEELVDALPGDGDDPGVPHTVADLTRRRMDALPEAARDVLRTAAVLATTVEWELLPAAAGRTEHEVATALRAGVEAALLVREPGPAGALRWRHALTRDAVLAALLPPERAAIARAAAAALDAGPDGETADRARLVAELYVQCGRGRTAGRQLLGPARAAVDAGALGSAEATLRRAAELAPDDHEIAVELVRVLTLAGRLDEAAARGAELRPVVRGEQLTLLCLHLARAAAAAERWAAADELLAPVASAGDPRVDAVRAHVALGEHDAGRAAALARTAAARGAEHGPPEAVCEALEIVGRALRRTEPSVSEAALAEAERCAAQHGLTVWRIRALFELGVNDVYHASRKDRLLLAQQQAEDAGMLATAAVLDVHIGTCVALCDGHVAMLPWAERAATRADLLGLAPVAAAARFFAAIGHLWADERARVAPLLAEARELAPESMDAGAHYADVEGMAAWVDGDLAGAVSIFDSNDERRRRNPGDIASPMWGVRALLRAVIDPDDASAADDLLADEIRWHACNEGARLYVDALVHARAGDLDGAERSITEGDRVLSGYRVWRHLLRLELVRPAAAGGFGAPERWLRAAFADLEGTGEVCMLRHCRDLMQELGLPVPRTRRDAPVVPADLRELGVTPREWQVLALVEQGRTNAQIAECLFLSPRTVETHVASLLAKTGLSRRTELRSR
ncbi:AAA family ATPase [Actinomycetospora lutea]|uniref:helix-turn-helix transcriptional regulator n=1 Tax=Actinomycetospora lutea TaxID=663604 RepID=UPI002366017B|nr:LuxR family transcriptional regulator [Actinomycetospora lutea]MDD7938802.1 AAA family ATPase [Actinomycetospora lutea]